MNTAINNNQVALARKDDLVVQEMPDEVLVYDLKSHKAHCLNQTAAVVWNHCDGQTTAAEIAGLMEQEWRKPVGEDVVWLALKQLDKANLLQEPLAKSEGGRRFSRREVIRRLGIGVAVAAPLIVTITSPQSVHAATCVPNNACSAATCGLPCGDTGQDCNTKICKRDGNSNNFSCAATQTPNC